MGVDREGPIHRATLHYLRLALPPISAKTIHHSPNEMNIRANRKSKAIAQNKSKALGMKKGWPDIQFVHVGRFYTMEAKSETGRLSKEQKECRDAIEAAGGFYAVVRSVDDAKAALIEWGIIGKEQK